MINAGLTSEEAECAWVRCSWDYLNAWKEYLEAGLIKLTAPVEAESGEKG